MRRVLLILFIIACCAKEEFDAQVYINLSGEKKSLDRKVYGHFIENLDGCIYGGIWDDTPSVEVIHRGMRVDVLNLIKRLSPPVIRFPGGLYADTYHWMNGIGDPSLRPTLPNLYWGTYGEVMGPPDTNQFGTDEYMLFLQEVDAEGYINVNFGTGTPEEARNWVEYVNGATTTFYGNMRAENGHPEPYGVKIWGIGNEIYGYWAFGHTDARSYAERYIEFANAMREVDSSIKLVAVGCDYDNDWNRTVLEIAGEYIDYLSVHTYMPGPFYFTIKNTVDEYYSFVSAPLVAEGMLNSVKSVILEYNSNIKIALDEWNIAWGFYFPNLTTPKFSVREMIFTAGMFIVFHRMADYLGMANYAQLVNLLGLIYTTETTATATPPYYAFELFSNNYLPYTAPVSVTSPVFSTSGAGNIPPMYDVPFIEASALTDETGTDFRIFILNRDAELTREIKIEVSPRIDSEIEITTLTSTSPFSKNVQKIQDEGRIRKGKITLSIPPHSVMMLKPRY